MLANRDIREPNGALYLIKPMLPVPKSAVTRTCATRTLHPNSAKNKADIFFPNDITNALPGFVLEQHRA